MNIDKIIEEAEKRLWATCENADDLIWLRSKLTEAYEAGQKAGAYELECCEHMPDDPDVTECHFCNFKKK